MKKTLTMLALATLLVAPFAAQAQDADEPNLARMWVVKPKPGTDQQLEDAMKAHNAWRKENKDPWSWNTYHTVTGSDLDLWYIRSPGHSYADFAAYGDSEFTKKAYEHWMANVDQYVAEYHGHIAEFAPEISQWPDDAGPFEWFWIYEYKLKPGHNRPFFAAAKAITEALKAAGWSETYGFVWQLTGDVPTMTLVIPEKDWGGFAGPETGAYDTVAQSMGEDQAKAMWAEFYSHATSVHSVVYHRHENMSFEGAAQ